MNLSEKERTFLLDDNNLEAYCLLYYWHIDEDIVSELKKIVSILLHENEECIENCRSHLFLAKTTYYNKRNKLVNFAKEANEFDFKIIDKKVKQFEKSNCNLYMLNTNPICRIGNDSVLFDILDYFEKFHHYGLKTMMNTIILKNIRPSLKTWANVYTLCEELNQLHAINDNQEIIKVFDTVEFNKERKELNVKFTDEYIQLLPSPIEKDNNTIILVDWKIQSTKGIKFKIHYKRNLYFAI